MDVGWSAVRRSSAVCRLVWTDQMVDWHIERFRAVEPERGDVLTRMAADPALVAAFDGPLRPDLAPVTAYRAAERMLTRRLGVLIGKPGASSSPVARTLNHHTMACVAHVVAAGALAAAAPPAAACGGRHAVAEAFPSSFLGLMLPDPAAVTARRSNRSDLFFTALAADGTLDRLVARLLPGRARARSFAAVRDHDERAALVCALGALGVAGREALAVGDAAGWIVLPPRALVADWAWPLLQANAADEPSGRLWEIAS